MSNYGKVLVPPVEESVLKAIYQDMPSSNFSREVLQPLSKQLGVMELEKVLWSDWGRPERIIETLQAVGIRPTFPPEVFKEVNASAKKKTEVEVV